MSIELRFHMERLDEVVAENASVHLKMIDNDVARLTVESAGQRVDVALVVVRGPKLVLAVQNREGC